MESPLVSVLVLTKDSKASIRRCLDALVKQDYANIEIVIQDGVSTDGTLDIIAGYNAPNIWLESEPDRFGASEAFYKGLKRCKGEIITLCWSDEEIFPHTVRWGVEQLGRNPDCAGIYGGVFTSDIKGVISGTDNVDIRQMAWNLEKALCWELLPNYVTSFFRKSALTESGFFERVASYFEEERVPHGCIMYEYYILPALRQPVRAVPHFMGKFASHKHQLCSQPQVLHQLLAELQESFDYVASLPDTPDWVRALRGRAMAGFHLMMIPNLLRFRFYDEAFDILKKAATLEYELGFFRSIAHHAVALLQGQWDFAQQNRFLDLIMEYDGDYFEWHHFRGYAHMGLEEFPQAIAAFRQSFTRNGMDKNSYRFAVELQLRMLMERADVRQKLADLFRVSPNNKSRMELITKNIKEFLTRDKRFSHKVAMFHKIGVARAYEVMEYLLGVMGEQDRELREMCIAAHYFGKGYFEDYAPAVVCE